jgi:hypothetical protein
MSDVITASPLLSMKYYLESTRARSDDKIVLLVNTPPPAL